MSVKENNKIKIEPKKIKCPICEKEKKLDQFYKSNKSEYKMFEGRCYICKICLKDKLYVNGIPNQQAMKEILEKYLDLPFIKKEYEKAIVNPKETLGTYVRLLNMGVYKGRNLTWKNNDEFNSDTYIEESIENDNCYEENIDILQKKWGNTYSLNELNKLQNFYDEFASEYETDLPAQRLNFTNAAKTQLQADKALEQGNTTVYNSLMNTLSKILGDSNVKPVQATGAEANDQLCWGTYVKKAEEEEPIDEWGNDEMKKYIDTYMVGHLAKMEGLHNEFVDMYEEAIKPWSVDFENTDDKEDENI